MTHGYMFDQPTGPKTCKMMFNKPFWERYPLPDCKNLALSFNQWSEPGNIRPLPGIKFFINLHPPKLFTNVVSQVGVKKTPFLKRLSNRYFSRYLPNSFFVVLSNFLATISILYFVDRFIWIYVFLSIFGLEMMTKYVKHEISWKVLVIDQIGYHNRILRTKIHKYTSF